MSVTNQKKKNLGRICTFQNLTPPLRFRNKTPSPQLQWRQICDLYSSSLTLFCVSVFWAVNTFCVCVCVCHSKTSGNVSLNKAAAWLFPSHGCTTEKNKQFSCRRVSQPVFIFGSVCSRALSLTAIIHFTILCHYCGQSLVQSQTDELARVVVVVVVSLQPDVWLHEVNTCGRRVICIQAQRETNEAEGERGRDVENRWASAWRSLGIEHSQWNTFNTFTQTVLRTSPDLTCSTL